MNASGKEKLFGSRLAAIFLIVITGAIIYSNSLRGPFLFDDTRTIVENEQIRNLSNYLSFDRILQKRPFADLTFALNYKFGQLNVFGYHVINLLIHLINGVIVYLLSGAILTQIFKSTSVHASNSASRPQKKRRPISSSEAHLYDIKQQIPMIALLAALIFVAHPIQTQAVSYICQRYASLAALFYLLSVLFYLKGRVIQVSWFKGSGQRNHQGQTEESRSCSVVRTQFLALYFLCIVSGVFAFLSKQTAASLPIVILLVEYFCIDSTWAGWRRKVPWIGLILLLTLIAVLYGLGGFHNGSSFGELMEDVSEASRDSKMVSRWSYLCTEFCVIASYIRLLFLPFGQNADPAFPFKAGFFDGATPILFLFLLCFIISAFWLRKRVPVISFGIFWFFITLSVESSIIPIRDAMFEHRLYLPVFGFSLTVSYTVFHFFWKKRGFATMISFVVVMLLGIAAYHRNEVWQSGKLLWGDVVSKSPWSSRAHMNLANALAREGETAKAVEHYKESLVIRPDDTETLMNMGNAMAMMGKYKEATALFKQLIYYEPRNAKAYFNMGTVLAHQDKIVEAETYFRRAIQINTNFTDAKINLAMALMRQRKLEEAEKLLQEILVADREQKDAHAYLGLLFAKKGKLTDAEKELAMAIQIDPLDVRPRINMGSVLAKQGRIDEAITQFREVLRIKPESKRALAYLNELRKRKTQNRTWGQNNQNKIER